MFSKTLINLILLKHSTAQCSGILRWYIAVVYCSSRVQWYWCYFWHISKDLAVSPLRDFYGSLSKPFCIVTRQNTHWEDICISLNGFMTTRILLFNLTKHSIQLFAL